MTPTERIEDLIDLTGQLAEVLTQENAALREQRVDEVAALLEQKANLARAYEARIKVLAKISDRLDEVDEDLRAQLRTNGDAMQALMEENAHLLKIGIKVGHQVMDSVAQAVKEMSTNTTTYGANGRVGGRSRGGPSSASVSLNRNL